MEGLTNTALKTIMADINNQKRGKTVLENKIKSFKNKNWSAFYDKSPIGYKDKDNDWIKTDPHEKEIIKEIFRYFVKKAESKRAYKDTQEFIENNYDSIEFSYYEIKGDTIKSSIYRKTYSRRRKTKEINNGKLVVEDKNLKILDDELYKKPQQKIRKLNQKKHRFR